MSRRRVKQLEFMLRDITKIDLTMAKSIIVDSEVGKAILDNDMTVLYEQQTENLAEIAREMSQNEKYQHLAQMLTLDNIAKAGKRLREYERTNTDKTEISLIIPQNKELKATLQMKMIGRRKSMLEKKRQNQMNIRRIEHVNKFKR